MGYLNSRATHRRPQHSSVSSNKENSDGASVTAPQSQLHSTPLNRDAKQLAKVSLPTGVHTKPKQNGGKIIEVSTSLQQGDDDVVAQHARLHAFTTRESVQPSLVPQKMAHRFSAEDVVILNNDIEPPQIIGVDQSKALDTLVFGGRGLFQEEWHQGFFFSDQPELRYGLVQLHGGPCGVIAVVQAFVIKELVFSPIFVKSGFNPSNHVRTTALVNALCEILWQAGGSKIAKVVLPPTLSQKFKAYKLADFIVHSFHNFDSLKQFIIQNQAIFVEREGPGVIAFVYSAILTRGVMQVHTDMDAPTNTLLGPHKYCSQELVNLLLVGTASSNVFDDTMDVGGTLLKGIFTRSTIGYLTLMEKMGYCQVGNNLKNAVFPIWIIYSESHYSVLFATSKTLSKEIFDLYYYDELGNQNEQYRISVDVTSQVATEFNEDDLVPPIEMCICTKWATAVCNWNGSEPLL